MSLKREKKLFGCLIKSSHHWFVYVSQSLTKDTIICVLLPTRSIYKCFILLDSHLLELFEIAVPHLQMCVNLIVNLCLNYCFHRPWYQKALGCLWKNMVSLFPYRFTRQRRFECLCLKMPIYLMRWTETSGCWWEPLRRTPMCCSAAQERVSCLCILNMWSEMYNFVNVTKSEVMKV